ncbi:MFS transporter, partial [Streptomyces sp. ZG43]
LAPRLRPERRTALLVPATCWLCVATAGALAVTRVPLVAGMLVMACMFLSTVASIGFLSTLLVVTPDDRVGRVQSSAGFLSSLVQPFGPLAGGALLGALGPAGAFTAIGTVLAVSAAVVTFAPSARAVPPHEAPVVDAEDAEDAEAKERPGRPDAPPAAAGDVPGSGRADPAAAAPPH